MGTTIEAPIQVEDPNSVFAVMGEEGDLEGNWLKKASRLILIHHERAINGIEKRD